MILILPTPPSLSHFLQPPHKNPPPPTSTSTTTTAQLKTQPHTTTKKLGNTITRFEDWLDGICGLPEEERERIRRER